MDDEPDTNTRQQIVDIQHSTIGSRKKDQEIVHGAVKLSCRAAHEEITGPVFEEKQLKKFPGATSLKSSIHGAASPCSTSHAAEPAEASGSFVDADFSRLDFDSRKELIELQKCKLGIIERGLDSARQNMQAICLNMQLINELLSAGELETSKRKQMLLANCGGCSRHSRKRSPANDGGEDETTKRPATRKKNDVDEK